MADPRERLGKTPDFSPSEEYRRQFIEDFNRFDRDFRRAEGDEPVWVSHMGAYAHLLAGPAGLSILEVNEVHRRLRFAGVIQPTRSAVIHGGRKYSVLVYTQDQFRAIFALMHNYANGRIGESLEELVTRTKAVVESDKIRNEIHQPLELEEHKVSIDPSQLSADAIKTGAVASILADIQHVKAQVEGKEVRRRGRPPKKAIMEEDVFMEPERVGLPDIARKIPRVEPSDLRRFKTVDYEMMGRIIEILRMHDPYEEFLGVLIGNEPLLRVYQRDGQSVYRIDEKVAIASVFVTAVNRRELARFSAKLEGVTNGEVIDAFRTCRAILKKIARRTIERYPAMHPDDLHKLLREKLHLLTLFERAQQVTLEGKAA